MEMKLGSFWLVQKARKNSVLEDVLALWTLEQYAYARMVDGALHESEIVGAYTEFDEAKREAEKVLANRDRAYEILERG
jgi:hypothetical protein